MSDTAVSTKNRRSKRRAAMVAEQKIKKIVDDDAHLERENKTLYEESKNRDQNVRKKKRITTKQSEESLFFENKQDDLSSSLSISNNSLSFASLSSIPERIRFSNSTNIGSMMSSSSLNDDRPIPDGLCFSDATNIGSTTSFSSMDEEITTYINKEIDRDERRRRRLVNSTGTMFFSKTTAYRVSLFSPTKSPPRAVKLSFSPFASFPTTPMHEYQYCARMSVGSRGTVGRLNHSARARQVRASCRGKRGVIKPRQLV